MTLILVIFTHKHAQFHVKLKDSLAVAQDHVLITQSVCNLYIALKANIDFKTHFIGVIRHIRNTSVLI